MRLDERARTIAKKIIAEILVHGFENDADIEKLLNGFEGSVSDFILRELDIAYDQGNIDGITNLLRGLRRSQ